MEKDQGVPEENLFCCFHSQNRGCTHPLTVKKERLNKLKYYCIKTVADLYLTNLTPTSKFFEIKCEGCNAFKPMEGLALKLKLRLNKNSKAKCFDALDFKCVPQKLPDKFKE